MVAPPRAGEDGGAKPEADPAASARRTRRRAAAAAPAPALAVLLPAGMVAGASG